jgi:DNA-binding response OmpR family regulator
LLEGNYCEEEKDYCLNTLGVNYYFSKPVRFNSLMQRISELIINRQQAEEFKSESEWNLPVEEEKKEENSKRILIADDDSFTSGILKAILEKENYNCYQTFSVKEVNSL